MDEIASTATPPPPQLLLTFDDQEAGSAAGREIRSDGGSAAIVEMLTVNKATAAFEKGSNGSTALRFPAYSGTSSGSFAALRIEPEEWLSPGEAEFTFGADIRLNKLTNGSEIDNGDNVLQRGLFADSAQYKIQVDKHRPSCVIRGSEGAVVVKSKQDLDPAKWYRLSCHRLDRTVTLTVSEVGSDAAPLVVEKTGAIGTLDLIGTEPLSIGAKIGADGEVVRSSTDQFNGWIDNVSYLRI
ncbi:hypothetical protein FB561_4446 [Kribbella amoyensis]|uniref:Concanavalin A-like lectin/glucanase superfamily protein n=2 Tax=Kribbella amoyensis TaxID=996641 RepID=A0A561BWL8_9ACTN|nr:hypothetical protein FB561_4446 [Kribbella amoyensis]